MALGPSSPAWGWKVRLDELQAVLAFGEGKADTRGLSWTEHQALSRQIRNQVSLLEELAGGMSRKLTAWKREVGVPQGAMAHTRADIQLLSGLLAECRELASSGLHFLEQPPPSLEVGEGTEEEVVPETPPEVASASKTPQASLTYAEAAKGEGVEARVFMGLPSDRLRGLLVSLKAQHAEADSGLAGVQAELREQREKSNRTSNYKRGPLRAAIAEKKLVEQHLSYTLLQTEKKIADIQAILQQRAKDAARSRRQRAMEGRRDMSPGEESSKDLDSNSHHSPGEPSTSALATPGGAAETEGKAREKDSEEEWDGEKGEEGRGLIKESLLKFGNELGEDSVKDKKKKKKKRKTSPGGVWRFHRGG
ncbi:Hypothetical predicted protein [Pelobates cultripes]|uniref:Uncharacterized protein n=1 Tax=Pelobates cultripes TaxID=61616 RepID=A0AAD1T8K0_PELCU|nr:Hypothetical predicted protein [Pelobates cultripes]